MPRWCVVAAILSASAVLTALPSPAGADVSMPVPAVPADPSPGAPASYLSYTAAQQPMSLACKATPALNAAVAADPTASADTITSLCTQLGDPLPASLPAPDTSLVPQSPSLCGNVGCAYIYLYNQGGGWGWTDYFADPYAAYGYIVTGALAGHQYTKRVAVNYFWSEPVVSNWGRNFSGYRSLWAHGGNSWVEVDVRGWARLSSGYYATIGPVETWTYITS